MDSQHALVENYSMGKTSQRQFFVTLSKAVVSVGLIYWLLERICVQNLVGQFVAGLWRWVLLSVTSFAVSNLLGSWQWNLLLRAKQINLSFWQVSSYYHVGLFFNNFLVGNIGGDAFRVYDIRRSSGDVTGAISAVFFDRFAGFFALSTLALMVAMVGLQQLFHNSTFYLVVFILTGWIFGLLFLFMEGFARKFSFIIKLLTPSTLHVKMRELYYSIHQFSQQKALLVKIFAIAFMVQGLRILTHYFAAYSVGVQANAAYFFIFIPIVALVASLPISLGGIGVREQSAVTLFAKVGIASAEVVAFELLAYIVGILASVPGGVIFAFRRETPAKEK